MTNPYNDDLCRNAANFQPLTPITFLERAASVFPSNTAIIYGELSWSYEAFFARSRQLASALRQRNVGRGDTVSVMLANTPPMLECHYGIPMCQAILHAINTRLDASTVAFQLEHANTKVLIVDSEYFSLIQEVMEMITVTPLVIVYNDPTIEFKQEHNQKNLNPIDYDEFVTAGDQNLIGN